LQPIKLILQAGHLPVKIVKARLKVTNEAIAKFRQDFFQLGTGNVFVFRHIFPPLIGFDPQLICSFYKNFDSEASSNFYLVFLTGRQ
jgi:hypothetical protein